MTHRRSSACRSCSAIILIATMAVAGHADVITVDDDDPAADFSTIQEAVDAAVGGDRIEVGPGYYLANTKEDVPVVEVVGKSIEILAVAADPASTVIAGQGSRRCVEWSFALGDCLLQGFTLDSGFTADDGGGIAIDLAALVI